MSERRKDNSMFGFYKEIIHLCPRVTAPLRGIQRLAVIATGTGFAVIASYNSQKTQPAGRSGRRSRNKKRRPVNLSRPNKMAIFSFCADGNFSPVASPSSYIFFHPWSCRRNGLSFLLSSSRAFNSSFKKRETLKA